MRRLVVAIVFVLIPALLGIAGTVTPGLLDAYGNRASTETVPTVIVLSNRVSASDLAESLQKSGMSLSAIHTQVMDALQVRAATEQPSVVSSVQILASTGMARNVRGLWLSNLIFAELTKPGAELVANMAGVTEVGLDPDVVLCKAVESSSSTISSADNAFTRMKIRDAWQLGFRGESQIVCNIGGGVDAANSALAGKWRGHFAAPGECLYDPAGSSSVCGDGTAETALMCGASSSGDTLGVAPAAQWIAAKLPCSRARLSDVLAALQWAADPDANSSTTNDVPTAVLNSWTLTSACDGAVPAALWEAVRNVEALGSVMIFPVGDEPSAGAGSVKAPASVSDFFAVGNVNTSAADPQIHPASERGPSPCDATVIKPDIVAPGTSVLGVSTSGPARLTGSVFAASYVAGLSMLLRQADANLLAMDVKRILFSTADDLGGPGPDNVYGSGLVNAEGALNAVLSAGRSGVIEGDVRYAGMPVSGARVTLSGDLGSFVTTTDPQGMYRFAHVTADRKYSLGVGKFGFNYHLQPDSVSVSAKITNYIYVNLEHGFNDDATRDQAWSLGVQGDNATSGQWVRAVPVGSHAKGQLVQPDQDAPPFDGYCFLTGNASSPSAGAGEADVNGGHTTLRSPIFDLVQTSDPVLHFWYWYSNDAGPNPGSDFFRAQISNDGGTTWTNLINTASSTDGWKSVTVKVGDFLLPTNRMMIQFIAEDSPPNSLVEAAVDNISISGTPNAPEAPRDLILDVQPDKVILTWRRAQGASGYNIYLGGNPERVVAPENLYTTTTDTTFTVPMSDIQFDQFYFQVTSLK